MSETNGQIEHETNGVVAENGKEANGDAVLEMKQKLAKEATSKAEGGDVVSEGEEDVSDEEDDGEEEEEEEEDDGPGLSALYGNTEDIDDEEDEDFDGEAGEDEEDLRRRQRPRRWGLRRFGGTRDSWPNLS